MRKDVQEQLVKALRSGEYVQAHGTLRTHDETRHCCLGVATDLMPRQIWALSAGFGMLHPLTIYAQGWQSDTGMLPNFVVDRAGNIYSLALLNDEGFSFEQIADFVQAFGEYL